MGYTTNFYGKIEITPPLNAQEVEYLQKFQSTRRMDREKGPYFVDGTGDYGQGRDADIRDYNRPPNDQPGLWCQWEPSTDGKYLEWDQGEKFYNAAEWMEYVIKHFLAPNCLAKSELPFLQANHVLNGVIEAQGEEYDDRWDLIVENNHVFTHDYVSTPAFDRDSIDYIVNYKEH